MGLHCLAQVINETLPTVVKLKQKGLVKAIGFSCLPLNTMKYVLDRVAPGKACGDRMG